MSRLRRSQAPRLVRRIRIMKLMRALMSVVVLGSLALTGLGCGGLSTEEATQRCDQARDLTGEQGCVDDAVFAQCVSCYEECGDDCQSSDPVTCPESFTCPAD
jgi:hypothetical protein